MKVIAGLLPRDVNLNVAVDPYDFATKFKQAVALLGNTARLPRPMKVIGR